MSIPQAIASLTGKAPLTWWTSRVAVTDMGHSSPCWVWTKATFANGYGQAWRGKAKRAHRVAHEELIGPIPPGYEVDHLCSVRACVNPAHLEAVTKQENIRRAIPATRIAATKRRKEFCVRGHRMAETVVVDKRGKRFCYACKMLHNRADRARRRLARAA
jgi:hypothetical protein